MTLDFASLTLVRVVGEFNGISLPVQPIRDNDKEFGSTLYAKILNPFGGKPNSIPKFGAKGVIIQKNKDDQQQVFWIGEIVTTDKYAVSSDEISLSHEDSKLALSNNGLSMEHKHGSIIQDSIKTEITQGLSKFSLSERNASIILNDQKGPLGSLIINNNEISAINAGSINLRTGTDMIFQSLNGGIKFAGKKENNSFKSLLNFEINTKNYSMLANGGPIFMEGGKMLINLSDARTTHSIPGMGGSTTFELDVLAGDIEMNTHAGNIFINNMNAASIGKIKIVNGSLLSPTAFMQTSIEMAVNKIELWQATIPFITESKITMKDAEIDLFATRDVTMSTNTNISINALTNVEIDAIIKAAVTAAKIEIISDLQSLIKTVTLMIKSDKMSVEASLAELNAKIMNLQGQILDASKMKTVKMGPKSVSPTGKGPFCAITICPWNGQVHVGDTAAG